MTSAVLQHSVIQPVVRGIGLTVGQEFFLAVYCIIRELQRGTKRDCVALNVWSRCSAANGSNVSVANTTQKCKHVVCKIWNLSKWS